MFSDRGPIGFSIIKLTLIIKFIDITEKTNMTFHLNYWASATLCVSIWSAIIGIALTIVFCVRSYQFFGSMKKCCSNKLVSVSILTMILCCIQMAFQCHDSLNVNDESVSILNQDFTYASTTYGLRYTLYCLSLTLRIYVSFKNNKKYELSRNSMICITILLVTNGIVCTTVIISSQYRHFQFINSDQFGSYVILIANGLWISFNIFVLFLFLKRLLAMIKNLTQAFENLLASPGYGNCGKHVRNHDINSNEWKGKNGALINLNSRIEHNRTELSEIIHVMTKISLLTMIEQFFYILYAIAFAIVIVSKLQFEYDRNQTQINNFAFGLLFSINNCWMCFVLYFTFVFNDNQYIRCCSRCHNCFKNWCIHLVTKYGL